MKIKSILISAILAGAIILPISNINTFADITENQVTDISFYIKGIEVVLVGEENNYQAQIQSTKNKIENNNIKQFEQMIKENNGDIKGHYEFIYLNEKDLKECPECGNITLNPKYYFEVGGQKICSECYNWKVIDNEYQKFLEYKKNLIDKYGEKMEELINQDI